VTLRWDAPTTNEDGSPVTLSGYKIYYGASSGSYTKSTSVASTGATSVTYTLSLSPGTYYFVVTAVSTDGQESAYSNEASKTL
jgi:fibronectin type 3 domain-containing protein